MVKKIEITKIIDEKLNEYPIRYNDLMNKTYSINSYEKFIQEFTLIKNSFKNTIDEFCDVADNQLEKMETLIKNCDRTDAEHVKQYIENNIFSSFGISKYSRDITIKTLFIQSLTNENAYSISTIKQIYEELGYNNLLSYIELLKNPNLLNSYLSESSKQNVALHYILFKTNHHSLSRFKRNNTPSNLYTLMESNINDSIDEIIKSKDDYIDFMNKEKEDYIKFKEEEKYKFDNWFSESNEEYNNFIETSKNNLENLETTYSEKLKIEEPSKFMMEKTEEYKNKTIHWAIAIVIVSIILLFLLGFILSPKIEFGKKIITVNLFSQEMPVYSSVIILSMICLIIYVIRIFIKIMMSSKHLSEEYRQKYVLTYFYLSLVNSGNVDPKLGNIILSILFTKADTGLIKGDSSNEYESLIKTLTSVGK